MKQSLYDYIQTRADEFIAVSDQIWEYAELSLNEYKSVECYLEFLKKEGFEIREQVANVPTAFAASYGTASTLSNTVLEKLIQKNLEAAPLPGYLPEDLAFAEAIHATYDCRDLPGTAPKFDWKVKQLVKELTNDGQKAVNDFVMPYVPSDYMSAGSTDVGDVSWLTPTAQFNAATWPSNCPGHSWQMVSTGKTRFAHEAMLYAGTVLAMTAYDLMTDPAILYEAKAEFAVTAAAGYDCPLEPDLVAQPAAI